MVQAPSGRRFDRDWLRVGAIATAASIVSLLYYFQDGQILWYGDAVAHINIARRVFDSLTPGPLQFGTVWLPLPHAVMIPFIWSDAMWQSGLGGSIPSMIAYVLGVVGIFRLVRGMEFDARTKPAAWVGAWVAAFAYGANPDLLYVQATALTEALYLAFLIWGLVYFAEFARSRGAPAGTREGGESSRFLRRCALCVAGAELSRYDGWILAAMLGALVAVKVVVRWDDRELRRVAVKFFLWIAIAPSLWLAYNSVVYGNALEFANGPYSAKAIEQRVGAPNPGAHHVGVAALYFVKSAQVGLAVGNWGRWWLLAAISATLIAVWKLRRRGAAVFLLLWSPLGFYALSIAYGSVPVHVPMWWPFAVFNQRYGLEMLPLFAVSAGVLTAGLATVRANHRWKFVAVALALIASSYVFVWRAKPLCWQEASRNWNIRRGLDTAVEHAVSGLPPESTFLMDLGAHVGVMERLGIPLRRVVSLENHRQWKRPVDPEGLWERSLADPGKYVDFVITFDGDLVDQGVNRIDLTLLSEIHASGQPRALIYRARRPLNQSR